MKKCQRFIIIIGCVIICQCITMIGMATDIFNIDLDPTGKQLTILGDSRAVNLVEGEMVEDKDGKVYHYISNACYENSTVRIIKDGEIQKIQDLSVGGTNTKQWRKVAIAPQGFLGFLDGTPFKTTDVTVISLGGNDVIHGLKKIADRDEIFYSAYYTFYSHVDVQSLWELLIDSLIRRRKGGIVSSFWEWPMDVQVDQTVMNMEIIARALLNNEKTSKVLVSDVAPAYNYWVNHLNFLKHQMTNEAVYKLSSKYINYLWPKLDREYGNRIQFVSTFAIFAKNLFQDGKTYYSSADGNILDDVHFSRKGKEVWSRMIALKMVEAGWFKSAVIIDPSDTTPPEITLEKGRAWNSPYEWQSEILPCWYPTSARVQLRFIVTDDKGIKFVTGGGALPESVNETAENGNATSITYAMNIDPNVAPGTYFVLVTAYDGNNNSRSFRIVYTKSVPWVVGAFDWWFYVSHVTYQLQQL